MRETRGARVMGQSSGINRESILHPGITRAPVEIGAVQRVIMPIPTPMSAPSGEEVVPHHHHHYQLSVDNINGSSIIL